MRIRTEPYNLDFLTALLEKENMQLDNYMLEQATWLASQNGISQHVFEDTIELYVEGLKRNFNPKTYSWSNRFMLALHFIFNFKRNW